LYICVFKYLNTFYKLSKLINISEASSIAIHAVVLVAKSGESLNVSQLAGKTGFSKNHMAKVLQQLAKYNFLESTRGPKGGFVLKRKPEEISLLEIYEAIEGIIDENHSFHNCKSCNLELCVFGGMSQKLTSDFKEYLKNTLVINLL